MVRNLAFVLMMFGATGCGPSASSQNGSPRVEKKQDSRSASEVWDFVDSGIGESQSRAFALTENPAKTCIGGSWRGAELLAGPKEGVVSPAYRLEGRNMEILLSNNTCDNYDSYIGTVDNGKFQGTHTSYGLGHSKDHGVVTGSRRR